MLEEMKPLSVLTDLLHISLLTWLVPSLQSLSGNIEGHHLRVILDKISLPDKASLLSISSPHAAAWLSSLRLNLHLEPAEFQTAVKWWLGIAVTDNPVCPLCPSHALDPLGHHALTCKHGGDVVSRHNRLRDVLLESSSS